MFFAELSFVKLGRRISEPAELGKSERHIYIRLKNAVLFGRKTSRRSVFDKSETHRLHSHMQYYFGVSEFKFSEIGKRSEPAFFHIVIPVLFIVVHRIDIGCENPRHTLGELRQNGIVPAAYVLSVIGRAQVFRVRSAG